MAGPSCRDAARIRTGCRCNSPFRAVKRSTGVAAKYPLTKVQRSSRGCREVEERPYLERGGPCPTWTRRIGIGSSSNGRSTSACRPATTRGAAQPRRPQEEDGRVSPARSLLRATGRFSPRSKAGLRMAVRRASSKTAQAIDRRVSSAASAPQLAMLSPWWRPPSGYRRPPWPRRPSAPPPRAGTRHRRGSA
jgi:hypothetical protein